MTYRKTLITLISAICLFSCSSVEKTQQPNIIFILVDDLGKEWISCYGADSIQTPHIDKLATSGTRFENVYSCPQCTPSRVEFMTGQYPYRNGWINHWDVPRWGIGYYDWELNPSIAKVMKNAGYATAVAGKWQINDFRITPDAMNKAGFDEYFMWTGGEGDNLKVSSARYWNPYIHSKDGSKTYEGKFGPDLYNQFLLDFITDNKDNPFFIYYPMTLTHTPFVHTPTEPNVKTKIEKHAAMTRYMDLLVGKMVNHLDELSISENTIVIWTTDNGTTPGITGFREGYQIQGGKMYTTENGINAPFIAACPSIIPSNKTSNALIDFADMLPTFADMANVDVPTDFTFDGISQKDVFYGEKENIRPWIMAMGSRPGVASPNGLHNKYWYRDRVIRNDKFKLYVGADRKPRALFSIENDVYEKVNLIDDANYITVVKNLMTIIDKMPTKDNDPKYRRRAEKPWDRELTFENEMDKKGSPKTPLVEKDFNNFWKRNYATSLSSN